MSRTDQPRNPLGALREVLGAEDATGSGVTFMRGLTLGALIGAAVAGSAIWRRRGGASRRRGRSAPPELLPPEREGP